MKKSIIAVVIAIVAVGAIALAISMNHKNAKKDTTTSKSSSTSESMNMNGSESQNSSAVATDKVDIKNFAFSPANITVKKGTKVTWTNSDSTSHTVTGDDNGALDSGTMNQGDTYSFTFDTVGTYQYHCVFHSNMTAQVTVTE